MNAAELIKYIIKTSVPVQVQLGKVVSIDENNATCTVEILNEPTRYDVRLRSIIDGTDGFIIIPSLQSYVLVGIIENNPVHSFVALFSSVDKIKIQTSNNLSLEFTHEQIKLNGDRFGGLVIVQKLVERLNAIENAFNELLNHYKTHNHAHPQGPTTGLLVPSDQMPLSSTQVDDIENKNVVHG